METPDSVFTGLSICIITKNQADKLERCLKAIHASLFPNIPDHKCEIVVVDTGSTDNTMEIANKYDAETYKFPWIDDFAAAKNAAISYAAHDLILILDTDEYIEPESSETDRISQLISTASADPKCVGRINRINKYTNVEGQEIEYSEWINRLFDRRLYHYEGRIHEQLVSVTNSSVTYPTRKTAIRIFHDGYDLSPEKMKEKAERDASLLKLSIKETPHDPYLWYQLGKANFAAKDYPAAEKAFCRGLNLNPSSNLEYTEDLIETAGYTLLNLKKAPEALQILVPYHNDDPFRNSADFQFLYATTLMNNGRFEDALNTFLYCTSLPDSRTRGTNSFMAWYNAGVILEVAGMSAEALDYYKKAGNYAPAAAGIERITSKSKI